MKRWSLVRAFGLALPVALAARPAAAQKSPDARWAPVRQVFGAPGEVEDGYLRFDFPRKDLAVSIGAHRLAPDFELTSYLGFVPKGAGRALVMGEVVLTDAEAGPVLAEAGRQGISVAALHNHLLRESPRIMYLHVMIEGAPKAVAEKLRRVLARTGAGGKAEEEREPSAAKARAARAGWSALSAELGQPEEADDSMAEWEFPRRERLAVHGTAVKSSGAIETASEVVVQRLGGGQVATTGEMFVLPGEIDAVARALGDGGIQVTAIHNHMTTGTPNMYWLHWYAVGDGAALGRTIRAALAHTNQQQPAGH